MMNRFILLFVSSFLIFQSVKSQGSISFLEEYIDFEIDEKYFSINGIYTFTNAGSKVAIQHISFPFAKNTLDIDSIRVFNLNLMQPVDFKVYEKSIFFIVEVFPHDTLEINIFYRQKVERTNQYIITTTKSWGNALRKAIYTLTVSPVIKIESFSYPPDLQKRIGENSFYFWEKKEFDPDLDMEFVIEEESYQRIRK